MRQNPFVCTNLDCFKYCYKTVIIPSDSNHLIALTLIVSSLVSDLTIQFKP